MSEERDPLEGVPADLRDWHQGALEGDLAVCAAPQPGRPGFPCIHNTNAHLPHRDVLGRTWRESDSEEALYVARRLVRNEDGTVTIPTRDHGDVTVPCPDWCTGREHGAGGARVDITHLSNDTEFPVETGEGLVPVLRTCLTERPFATREDERRVHVTVEVDGEWFPMDPLGLDAVAAALVEHARTLRRLAERLADLQGGE